MSEPMVSHDVVAFYLLSERVASTIKVVQSGQGADEVFAGYHWYPPLAGVDREAARRRLRRRRSSTATTPRCARVVLRPVRPRRGPEPRRFVRAHFAAPGAQTAVDAALRLDTEVMLVDDPVKRVDNMTMAWGLEARVPFLDHELVELAARVPAGAQARRRRQGRAQGDGRRVVPPEVIDRPKGYFPVPAITHLEGKVLDLVRDALHAPPPASAGCSATSTCSELLADPNAELTPLRGNKLWQLGLLELWLQTHEV